MTEDLKKQVGEAAVDYVEDGMTVGLGTGSTIHYTIQKLGELVKAEKIDISVVSTSLDTEQKAKKLGMRTENVNSVKKIDVAIDGADEVSKDLDLIKGGGGALTREKIVDYMAEKFIVVVDESKLKGILGDFPIPIEVLPYSWYQTKRQLEALGAAVSQRTEGGQYNKPFVTDNGMYILDAKFEHIFKPAQLEKIINNMPGVIENGIFRNEKVHKVLVATAQGIKTLPEEVEAPTPA
jgi:ribose 5-phosphate isomerase A